MLLVNIDLWPKKPECRLQVPAFLVLSWRAKTGHQLCVSRCHVGHVVRNLGQAQTHICKALCRDLQHWKQSRFSVFPSQKSRCFVPCRHFIWKHGASPSLGWRQQDQSDSHIVICTLWLPFEPHQLAGQMLASPICCTALPRQGGVDNAWHDLASVDIEWKLEVWF